MNKLDEHNARAGRIIRILLLIMAISILSSFAFEILLGIAPSFIEAVAIVVLVVIFMWLTEKT